VEFEADLPKYLRQLIGVSTFIRTAVRRPAIFTVGSNIAEDMTGTMQYESDYWRRTLNR